MTDFSEALRAVKDDGGAYRAAWRDCGYTGVLRLRHVLPFAPLLVIEFPDGAPAWPFAAAQRDLLADDWEAVS